MLTLIQIFDWSNNLPHLQTQVIGIKCIRHGQEIRGMKGMKHKKILFIIFPFNYIHC